MISLNLPFPPEDKSTFYYFLIDKEDDNISYITRNYLDCLGYIGDVICTIKYKDCEYSGWRTLLKNYNFIFNVTPTNSIIIGIANCNSKMTELINTVNRISDNWGLSCTIILDNNVLLIEIPKSIFIATKWKVQGMMQVLRVLYLNQRVQAQSEVTINNQKYTRFNVVGMYTENLSWVYTLSFAEIDNVLHFTDKDDPVYNQNMLCYSHSIGVIELIPHIVTKYVS